MRSLAAGAVAAPAVKSVVTLPDKPETMGRTPGWLPSVISGMYDVQDAVIYDRIRFRPGQTIPHRLHMFTTPIGQPCPYTQVIKTFRHTNMYMAGQFEAPREMIVQRILFAVHPSAHQDDLDALSSACSWEFQLMCKVMRRGPMLLNGPARAGLRDVIAEHGSPTELGKVAPLSDAVLASAHHSPLTTGVYIPTLCSFMFRIESEAPITLRAGFMGGTGVDLLIAFQGAEARGVQ